MLVQILVGYNVGNVVMSIKKMWKCLFCNDVDEEYLAGMCMKCSLKTLRNHDRRQRSWNGK